MTEYITKKTLILLMIWVSTIGGLTAQVVWPIQDGSHDMFTGFGDGYDGNNWGFHEGIDMLGVGRAVVAARRGIIVAKDTGSSGGTITIDVIGTTQYDVYLHIDNFTAKALYDTVAMGEVLGNIRGGIYPAGYEHLHFMVINFFDPGGSVSGVSADGSNILNPFTIFTNAADQDPEGNKPELKDNNGDGETILFHDQADNLIGGLTVPIYGEVDILVDASDDMTTSLAFDQGVHAAGYWVESMLGGGENVKTDASPYMLCKFDNAWFASGSAAGKVFQVYHYNYPTAGFPFTNEIYNQYIVTNTTGTTGEEQFVDGNQFWKTDAKVGTGAEANGSDADDALVNEEAKFKDGNYRIHVKLEDMVNQETYTTAEFLVDNFAPYVSQIEVDMDGSILYDATWDWDGAALTLNSNSSPKEPKAAEIVIRITTSETMQNVNVSVPDMMVNGAAVSQNQDMTEWEFTIPSSTVEFAKPCQYAIEIEGQDLNGNDLERRPANLSKRDVNGNFDPAPSGSPDDNHKFAFTLPTLMVIPEEILYCEIPDYPVEIRLDPEPKPCAHHQDCIYTWSTGETDVTSIMITADGAYDVTIEYLPNCQQVVMVNVIEREDNCDCNPGDACWEVPVLHAVDPNDITGPLGYDTAHWVAVADEMGYTIRFENDPDFATAPAQVVKITHPIDEHLNLNSFRLGSFGFGAFHFEPPANSAFYSTQLDVVDSLGVMVNLTAGIDVVKKEAFWIFESVDPLTGQPPTDALLGFLPVNDTATNRFNDTIPQRGEGYVNFTITPLASAQTGDSVKATASIIFDINAPIVTNTWLNLLDAGAPTTTVNPLASMYDTTTITLTWSGIDDSGGVGLHYVDLYVAQDGGAFVLYQSGITDTSLLFTGVSGSTYEFYSLGVDYVGNTEAIKFTPDTQTELRKLGLISLKAFLEGAYCLTTCPSGAPAGTMDTLLASRGVIPLTQPYDSIKLADGSNWAYHGAEMATSLPSSDIVDWVMVSFRSDTVASSAFDSLAVFLRADGQLVTVEGDSLLDFAQKEGVDSFFVVIEHYNHLPVMSSRRLTSLDGRHYAYDFTVAETQAYTVGGSAGLKDLSGTGVGPYGLYGGNGHYDLILDSDDKSSWLGENLQFNLYLPSNYRLDLNINPDDQRVWLKNNSKYSGVPR